MKAKLTTALVLFLAYQSVLAADKPSIPSVDRTRLAEMFRLGDRLGDAVWPGWAKAPFAVLLVTPEYEFLLRHPAPSSDFTKLGYDSLLKRATFTIASELRRSVFWRLFPPSTEA